MQSALTEASSDLHWILWIYFYRFFVCISEIASIQHIQLHRVHAGYSSSPQSLSSRTEMHIG